MHYELATGRLTGCTRMMRLVLLHDWIAERRQVNRLRPNVASGRLGAPGVTVGVS